MPIHDLSPFDNREKPAMNGWGITGIVVAALAVLAFLVALPDALRYLRIRRM
jgi:hypothetical protein